MKHTEVFERGTSVVWLNLQHYKHALICYTFNSVLNGHLIKMRSWSPILWLLATLRWRGVIISQLIITAES